MINHASATPKYIQLAENLEELISKGEIKADERLYSENELCKKYDVSRITVRQALSILEAKDLIYTVHGKGTFVKMPTLSQSLTEIVSFSKMLSLKGLKGSTKIESFSPSSKNCKARELLKLNEEEKLQRLNLLGFVESSPVTFYRSYFNEELGEKMYNQALKMESMKKPFTTLDLYKALNIKLSHVEQTITAEVTDSETNAVFGLNENGALVVLESVFYDAHSNPIEYKIGRYRSDFYSFKMKRMLK